MKYQKLKSPIHKIDPRTKLLYLFFAILFAIYSRNLPTLGLLLLLAATAFKLSKLSFSEFFAETRLLMVFLALLFGFQLYLNGFQFAILTVLFLFDIFIMVATLIKTTHPSDLAHSLVNWKVPYEFAFLFALTLRFVPVIQRELVEVRAAQASRGHRMRYPWDSIPLMLPLLHKLFKRAFDLSVALESKAFSGDRTFYRTLSFGAVDYLLLAALPASVLLWLL